MTIFFNEVKKIFTELMSEINHKLHDSLYLKEKDFNDLVLYNKEKYNEQISSSESIRSRSHSSSNSQSHITKASPNKASSINSNTIINKDKFNNTKNILSNKKSYEFLNTNSDILLNQKNIIKLHIIFFQKLFWGC
jgi:hypothetical protein